MFSLAAVACEAAAAWWVGARADGAVAVPAIALGLLGVLLAAATGWLLLRRNEITRLELRRARAASARAVDQDAALARAQRDAAAARELLVLALDALPIGIAIFDQHDRQLMRNKCLSDMVPGLFRPQDQGESFETIVRRVLQMGLLPEAIGREEEWLAARLADRHRGGKPFLQRHSGDQWINTHEVLTPQGYTVEALTDVTELVRKEQQLEYAVLQLSRQSATDGLTGIANRRRFDETLASEWLRAARSNNSLSLLVVDIDHFKRFNDHYGHLAGDECLRRVTVVLQGCVRRAGELLARYGGEEFVMLLPGADLAHAEDVAQRCLEHMAREAVPHVSSPTAAHVTFSIGVAHVFPNATHGPDTLVNAADTAMYRAKTAGRARYAVADLADWQIDKDAPRSQAGDLS